MKPLSAMNALFILLLSLFLLQGCITFKEDTSNDARFTKIEELEANDLNDVIFANDLFIAVGSDGTITYSSDGRLWQKCASPTVEQLNKIRFINKTFFVLGNMGTILISPDGRQWEQIESGVQEELVDIIFNKSEYLIAAKKGIVLKSPDQRNWKSYQLSRLPDFYSLATDGTFYYAGTDSEEIYLSADGLEWQQVFDGVDGPYIDSILINENGYLACSSDGGSGLIFLSEDGLDWKRIDTRLGNLREIIWDGKQYAGATGWAGTGAFVSSPDGVHWTEEKITTEYLNGIAAGPGNYVIVGEAGGIHFSADRSGWEKIAFKNGSFIEDAVYGKGTFVVVESDHIFDKTGRVYLSEDGVNWQVKEVPEVVHFQEIAYKDDYFVASDWDDSIYLSHDAVEWVKLHSSLISSVADIIVLGDYFFLTTRENHMYRSTDGAEWIKIDVTEHDIPISSVAYNGDVYCSTGYTSTYHPSTDTLPGHYTYKTYFFTSPDGIRWQKSKQYNDNRITGIISKDNLFIAYGTEGVILTSTGSDEWNEHYLESGETINDMAWTGTVLIAAGQKGGIYTSAAGTKWSKEPQLTTNNLKTIAISGKIAVIAGYNSTFLYWKMD